MCNDHSRLSEDRPKPDSTRAAADENTSFVISKVLDQVLSRLAVDDELTLDTTNNCLNYKSAAAFSKALLYWL